MGHPCHKVAVLFPATRIVPPATLRTLLSIGLTFFFCALKRRYLDQDPLAFVAATRPTKTNNNRRKTGVPFGTTRESSIPSREVLQMIQISTAQTQGLFPIHEEELTLPNHLATIRALRVTENLKNNEVFGPSCLALIRVHGSTTYPPVFNMPGVEAPRSVEAEAAVCESLNAQPPVLPGEGLLPFDVVLVDDTSRISRTLKDSFTIHDELRFAGVRLIFVSQGIDTESEQAEVLLATRGIVDSLYIRELAKKTHRGVEGRALQGFHTGGRCFAYRNVPIEDATRVDQHGRPVISSVLLEVREDEAAIVRRIFEMYAHGNSLQKIAKQLNAEGVVSPQPQKGRISRSWCPSSVRTILRNERYRGHVIWGRTVKVRSKSW